MSYAHIEMRPIAAAIGTERSGVDVSQGLTGEIVAEIRRGWLEHAVVLFRDQELTPEKQVALARRFGEPVGYAFVQGLPDFPVINTPFARYRASLEVSVKSG